MGSRLLAGRYELLEKIGDGGMAVVYKAKDKLLNRYIAIKILRPEFTKDASFVENFKRESQAAAGLTHQNIVGVYDVGKEGNINYIVMELIEGRTLNEIIAEKAPMDYREVINISRQVASALKVAHKNKIIHRDIKPHNIMVTSEGVVKLADFGIAKAVNDATLSTGSKIIGSVHYFSPEQARGNYVDERSDIYSLGIVMYEMLTGKVPFDGENPVTVALKHINEEITPPSKLVDGIPPALEQAVMKATNKFQTNRFSSAEELIEELDNIEFVTRMVGSSIFANASETVEMQKKQDQLETDPDDDDDDDDDGGFGRKLIPVIVAALVLIAAVFGGVYAFRAGLFSGDRTVPDLTNMSYEKAEQEATEAGFEIKQGKDVYSASIAEGVIAEQSPAGNTKAKKGSTITVNISKGSKEGTVPNLVGHSYEEAAQILGEDYTLGAVKKETSTQKEGTILSQDPLGGSTADKGTQVNIVISDGRGVEKGIVPSVTGKTLDDAKAEITKAGFQVGKVTYDESNAYGSGYVMWQQYGANTQLDKGTRIDIEVSKGAPKVVEEDKDKNKDKESGGSSGGSGSSGSASGGSGSSSGSTGNTGTTDGSGGTESGGGENSGATGGNTNTESGTETTSGDGSETVEGGQ